MSQIQLSSIEHCFGTIEDPRIDRQKRHKAIDIITLTITASLCGAEHWTEVEVFGNAKLAWLKTFLELPNGVPWHDTIGRFFSALAPNLFQEALLQWVQGLGDLVAGQVVALDGKCLRHSYDNGNDKRAIHMVSAWASEQSLVLGQVKTDAKSNEITAIPELLQVLQLKGCIVTIDAAGCQKNIAEEIRAQDADYVLALKGNQGNTHKYVQDYFRVAQETEFCGVECDTVETVDGGHGRVEVRRYWVVEVPDDLPGKSAWRDITTIGRVESERHIDDKVSRESRYYIGSIEANAEVFAKAVRAHWGIENRLHWCLDVGFREDECRVRKGFASENFAVIRHIAMNLLKREKTCKLGIQGKRLRAGWDTGYLTKLLGA